MDAPLVSRMKALDGENKRLKKMYAEKSMQNDLLKEERLCRTIQPNSQN